MYPSMHPALSPTRLMQEVQRVLNDSPLFFHLIFLLFEQHHIPYAEHEEAHSPKRRVAVIVPLGLVSLYLWIQELRVAGACLAQSLAVPDGREHSESTLYHTAPIIPPLIPALPEMEC